MWKTWSLAPFLYKLILFKLISIENHPVHYRLFNY
jgi:hypothetical protein